MIDDQGRKSAQAKPASGIQWRRRGVGKNRFLISSNLALSSSTIDRPATRHKRSESRKDAHLGHDDSDRPLDHERLSLEVLYRGF